MEQQIFCDGIGRISIIGGVVRLDLFTYSPTETDANGQPRPILSHRIVMGIDGFLRSSEKVVEAVQIVTRPKPPAEAPQPASQAAPQHLRPVQSPQWPPQAQGPAPVKPPAPQPPSPQPQQSAPPPTAPQPQPQQPSAPSAKPPFP